MELQRFEFNLFGENTYILWNASAEAAIVDPGMADAEETSLIEAFISGHALTLKYILHHRPCQGLPWSFPR